MLIITKYNTYKNSSFMIFDTNTMKQKLVKTTEELKDIYIKHSGECYNFMFDNRGFRYLTNEDIKTGIKYNLTIKNLEDDIKLLDTKGIRKDLQSLKELIPDNQTAITEVTNTRKKILLAEKTNNKEIVDATNLLVSKLDEVLNKLEENSTKTEDTLSVLDKKLEELGITFEDYLKKYDALATDLQAEIQKEYLYPSCGVDMYSDRHELSDISVLSLSKLNEEIPMLLTANSIKSLNKLGEIRLIDSVTENDKEIITNLVYHLQLKNKVRVKADKILEANIHSDDVVKNRLKEVYRVLGLTGLTFTIGLPLGLFSKTGTLVAFFFG